MEPNRPKLNHLIPESVTEFHKKVILFTDYTFERHTSIICMPLIFTLLTKGKIYEQTNLYINCLLLIFNFTP